MGGTLVAPEPFGHGKWVHRNYSSLMRQRKRTSVQGTESWFDFCVPTSCVWGGACMGQGR